MRQKSTRICGISLNQSENAARMRYKRLASLVTLMCARAAVCAFSLWLVLSPCVTFASIQGGDPAFPNPDNVNYLLHNLAAGDDWIRISVRNNVQGGTIDAIVNGVNDWAGTLDVNGTWGQFNYTNGFFHARGDWTTNSTGRLTITGNQLLAFPFTYFAMTNAVYTNNGTTTLTAIAPARVGGMIFTLSTLLNNSTGSNTYGGTINVGVVDPDGTRGNVYLLGSTLTATGMPSRTATINAGTVFFSGSPSHSGSFGTGNSEQLWDGYRYFNVASYTGGTANLRFTHFGIPTGQLTTANFINAILAARPEADTRFTVFGVETPLFRMDNKTIINAGVDAWISNFGIVYFDGTNGRASEWFRINEQGHTGGYPALFSNGTANHFFAHVNDNWVYNAILTRTEATDLSISSRISIAKKDTEERRDLLYELHNPDSVQYYDGVVKVLGAPLGTASPDYKPQYDPTNNPLSGFYTVGGLYGGKYNAKYDPANPIHIGDPADSRYNAALYNPNNAAVYNPKFDPSRLDYDPATRVIKDAVTGVLTAGHIAYNPYIDKDGYSGGLTLAGNGTVIFTVNSAYVRADAIGIDRDINSLIDVQGGTLRFSSIYDLRPVYQIDPINQNDPLDLDNLDTRWNFNPNGTPLVNGKTDKTNYYTIQLNALTNPIAVGTPPTATILSTSSGTTFYYDPHSAITPTHNQEPTGGVGRVEINNRIVLHGGGTIRVGYGLYYDNNQMWPEDDSAYWVYNPNTNDGYSGGGGLGNWIGYLWLNDATLVLEQATGDMGVGASSNPFLNKTDRGVLDLTNVKWESADDFDAAQINIQQGTLAFTNQKDLGTNGITIFGRDAILAIIKDSTLDSNYRATNLNDVNEKVNTAAGETVLARNITLLDGGTINVVQGGRGFNPVTNAFYHPYFSETNPTKTRENDGYENQHNLIIQADQMDGNGVLRKIGLGKLTLEDALSIVNGGGVIGVAGMHGLEIQRGTVAFSKQENLGNNAIAFSLDKYATLQYIGIESGTIANNINITYDANRYNNGSGATFDIQNVDGNATTLKLTGNITSNRNNAVLIKIGQLNTTLDLTEARVFYALGTGSASEWDIRTGTLAFDWQGNLGSAKLLMSEQTTLHKVLRYDVNNNPIAGSEVATLANSISFGHNGAIDVDYNATLTLTGNLTVIRQLDKLGLGTLVFDGAISNQGPKSKPDPIISSTTNIDGGLYVKEGNIGFSEVSNLMTKEGDGIELNFFGTNTGLVYSSTRGDYDRVTGLPKPLVISNEIHLLKSAGNDRGATITVTDPTGNLQLTGAQIRGGNFNIRDLENDPAKIAAGRDPSLVSKTYKTTPVAGDSILVKKGVGTLTLVGVLNDEDGEDISLDIQEGKIAFAQQDSVGIHDIKIRGLKAGLEYLGAGTIAAPATIANNIILYEGGGVISVLDKDAVFKLNPNQVSGDAALPENKTYAGTWTLGKGGAGTLDMTGSNFGLFDVANDPAAPLGKRPIDLAIYDGKVRFAAQSDIGTGTVTMGRETGNPVTPFTTGMLVFAGAGNTIISNNIILNGGIRTVAGTQTVAGGGGVNVGGFDLTLTGVISGVGNFTKEGAGTLVLSNTNTFLGNLTVKEGGLTISQRQSFQGDLIIQNGCVDATVANVLTSSNNLYLGSGAIFDMSTAGANQTIAGVYEYRINGAVHATPSKIYVSPLAGLGGTEIDTTCRLDDDVLTGNTLTINATGASPSRVGAIYGNEHSTLTVNGYLIASLAHFHGNIFITPGGQIIDPGASNSGKQTLDGSTQDVTSWVSCDVTLINGSHITVGQNATPTNPLGTWASCNVSLSDASTIDIKKDWITSRLHPEDMKPTNVSITSGSRISVGGNMGDTGKIAIDNGKLYVGGNWQHYETIPGGGNWVAGLYDSTLAADPRYSYNQEWNGVNPPTNHAIRWVQAAGNLNAGWQNGGDWYGSDVAATNGSTVLVGGNWQSGNVAISGGSTVTVGMTTGAGGTLQTSANTGKFTSSSSISRPDGGLDEIGHLVNIEGGSSVTVYENWKSGELTVTNSTLTVGTTTAGSGNVTLRSTDAQGIIGENATLTGSTVDVKRNWTGGDLLVAGSNLTIGGTLESLLRANSTTLGGKVVVDNGSTMNVGSDWRGRTLHVTESTLTVGGDMTNERPVGVLAGNVYVDWEGAYTGAQDSTVDIKGSLTNRTNIAGGITAATLSSDFVGGAIEVESSRATVSGGLAGNWTPGTNLVNGVQVVLRYANGDRKGTGGTHLNNVNQILPLRNAAGEPLVWEWTDPTDFSKGGKYVNVAGVEGTPITGTPLYWAGDTKRLGDGRTQFVEADGSPVLGPLGAGVTQPIFASTGGLMAGGDVENGVVIAGGIQNSTFYGEFVGGVVRVQGGNLVTGQRDAAGQPVGADGNLTTGTRISGDITDSTFSKNYLGSSTEVDGGFMSVSKNYTGGTVIVGQIENSKFYGQWIGSQNLFTNNAGAEVYGNWTSGTTITEGIRGSSFGPANTATLGNWVGDMTSIIANSDVQVDGNWTSGTFLGAVGGSSFNTHWLGSSLAVNGGSSLTVGQRDATTGVVTGGEFTNATVIGDGGWNTDSVVKGNWTGSVLALGIAGTPGTAGNLTVYGNLENSVDVTIVGNTGNPFQGQSITGSRIRLENGSTLVVGSKSPQSLLPIANVGDVRNVATFTGLSFDLSTYRGTFTGSEIVVVGGSTLDATGSLENYTDVKGERFGGFVGVSGAGSATTFGGNWLGGDVLIEGGGNVTVGTWNPAPTASHIRISGGNFVAVKSLEDNTVILFDTINDKNNIPTADDMVEVIGAQVAVTTGGTLKVANDFFAGSVVGNAGMFDIGGNVLTKSVVRTVSSGIANYADVYGRVQLNDSTMYVGGDWDSGDVTMTNASKLRIGAWNPATSAFLADGTGNLNTHGKSFTANGGSIDLGGDWTTGLVSLTGVRSTIAGDWTSGQASLSSTFLNIAGKFDADGEQVRIQNQSTIFARSWQSGAVYATGGGNYVTVVNDWISGDVKADGREFTIGRHFTAGNVETKNTAWSVGGDWKSSITSITDAASFKAGSFTSDALSLSSNGMVMTIAGNFNPGRELWLNAPSNIRPVSAGESLFPVYDIQVGGTADLRNTSIGVNGATNLLSLGRYYIGSINANTLQVSTPLNVVNTSLVKRVVLEQPSVSQLDVYVVSTGFVGYADAVKQNGFGGLTHNQIEVVNNMARIQEQITAFETAAAEAQVQRSLVSASSLNEPATTSPLRNNAVVTDVLVKLMAYGDDESIPVAERIAKIGRALNEITGDTHANGLLIASTRPWMEGYDRLRMDNEMYFVGQNYVASSQEMRGQQARLARMNRLWITPSYTFDSLSSDGNARAASLGRTGFSLGLDRRIRHNATAGVLFNYNSARLTQDEDRVQGNDVGIGLYAGAMVGYYIELRGFMGCGWQNYESTRILDTTDMNGNRDSANGRANGHSFSGSLEAARPLFFGLFIFKPTLGIDFTSHARDAFTETGDAIRLHVGRTTYTRVAPRIGATWEAGTMNRLAVTTRFFAGYNMGDDFITAQTQFDTIDGAVKQEIRSTVLGRGFIDAGIGSRYYLNNTRSMSLHGNADVISSKRSLAGAFSIGASWMY